MWVASGTASCDTGQYPEGPGVEPELPFTR